MGALFLDGIHDMNTALEEYEADLTTDCFSLKRDIWMRITILAHTALIIVRTVLVQLLRGTAMIIAGGIHLDGEKFSMGVKDYLSILIQIIVLPLLGLLTFFLPTTGYRILNKLHKYDTHRTLSNIVYQHVENAKESCHAVRMNSSQAIVSIFGSISALIQMVTLTIEYLLFLDFREAGDCLKTYGILTLVSLKIGLTSCCLGNSSRETYSAHRIALESFNPSGIFE